MTDSELMQQVASGDTAAMRSIYEQYNRSIYGYLLRQTRNAELSADLAQTVFYRALKYSTSYRSSHGVRTWLFQIARNVLRSHWAKEQLNPTTLYEQLPEGPNDWPPNEAPFELLAKALQRLSPAERELIELHRYQDLSYADIGIVLGISPDAVKMRAHRAMKNLKELFFQIENQ